MLAIRLPADIEKRLASLAKKTGRTKTFYAREAILEHLEMIEDTFLGEKRLAAFEENKERAIPLGALLKRYGVED